MSASSIALPCESWYTPPYRTATFEPGSHATEADALGVGIEPVSEMFDQSMVAGLNAQASIEQVSAQPPTMRNSSLSGSQTIDAP